MKNNLIIAGVPRAGKSTLSHALSREYGYQHVSMDSVVAGFESVFPELDVAWWPSKAPGVPPLDVLQAASDKIARFIAAMLDSGEYDEFEPGMVVDVCQLFPSDYMKYLNGKNCEIMYLITSDVTPEERFQIQRSHDTAKDYTFYDSDDVLRAGCAQLVEQSKYLKEQCVKYGLPYHETAKDREKVLERCMKSIGS
jgi:hypothetical protein